MMIPVLTTKLSRPQLPDGLISRESLLRDSDWASVILVSAQAGSGKSTVVSAWLSQSSKAHCWYALDDWDNDLMQFFAYLVAGIGAIDLSASEALTQLLDAFPSIGFEAFLRALINQLHAIKSPYILILDDYHVIRNDQIHQVMRTILEHFPPAMQLVLITREDPPFPLARMRAAKRLTELRMSQLRFTREEVKAYFLQQLGVSLDDDHLQHLISRTEGWIAGLQMTALSMQGVGDISSFIKALSGSHHYIMDYLLEEVLERQTPDIETFLLGTSILRFFSDDLCDAVIQLEAGSSRTIIQRLVKTNSFIVATDSSHRWFRYHHLFRDLLRQRLEQQSKGGMESHSLHYRAGVWFKSNGFVQEAIDHLLKANAFEEAAGLIECKWAEMDAQLQSASWLDMAKRLPSPLLERSPVLMMGCGWALLDMGDMEASKEWFAKALRLYDLCQEDVRPDNAIISDQAQFALLPATIASAYGYIAAAVGDGEGTFRHTRYALERLPSDQHFKRGVGEMLLGFAHWGKGELPEAESVMVHSSRNIRQAANPLLENSYYMVLAELYVQQGAWSKARGLIERTISRLSKENLVPILLPNLYLGLAKVAFLQGDNGQAYVLLEESKKHGQRFALPDWKYKYHLLLARVYCSEGLYDLARDCISESKAHFFVNPVPDDISIVEIAEQIEVAAAKHQPSQPPSVRSGLAFRKEHANQSLSQPLTARELEVLSLIVSGLSNKEICDSLFLALSTVKGYNQNIFGKLQVNRRAQAVAKALELGLV